MIYSEPLINQISRFISSIGFGFVICFLYLAVVFFRMTVSEKKWAIIAQDIVYGLITTVISFFFMVIYNNGETRWNLVFGEFLGAGVLYFTVGRYLLKFMGKGAVAIRKILSLLTLPLRLYFKAFPRFFLYVFGRIKEKFKKKKREPDSKDVSEDKENNKTNKKQRKNRNKKRKYSQKTIAKSE